MSLIDNIATRLGYIKAPVKVPAFLSALGDVERYSVPDYALSENQLKLYQVLPWVSEAVGHVARYSASVPLSVMRMVDEDTEGIVNHPFEILLRRPNPVQSRFRLLEATVAHLLLTGNAYWWLNMVGGPPAELYTIMPHVICPVTGGKIGVISHYEFDAGGDKKIKIPPEEIVHFAEFHPTKMFVGLSRVEAIAKDAEKDIKASEYDLNFFGKDNAKPEGILAFKGRVEAAEWARLEAEIKRRHGGTKRGLLMAQSADDVSYIQMALNHLDMALYDGRTFTKEEIFNHFAPGLASVLAVNATEANSRSGKATLMEFGIYPVLCSLAETITNKILPFYADNLVCEFDDVRLSDRAMELQEQDRAARVMTIEEFRAHYYDLEPLGDDRDDQLVVEGGEMGPIALYPPISPSQRLLETGSRRGDQEQTGGYDEADVAAEPPVKATVREVSPSYDQLVRDEILTWQRWTENRIKSGRRMDGREFETEHIPAALRAAIEDELETVSTVESARLVFANARLWGTYP